MFFVTGITVIKIKRNIASEFVLANGQVTLVVRLCNIYWHKQREQVLACHVFFLNFVQCSFQQHGTSHKKKSHSIILIISSLIDNMWYTNGQKWCKLLDHIIMANQYPLTLS